MSSGNWLVCGQARQGSGQSVGEELEAGLDRESALERNDLAAIHHGSCERADAPAEEVIAFA